MVFMYKKMISDGLLLVGIVLVVIGWSGHEINGVQGIFSWILVVLGLILGIWALFRYTRGHGMED